MPFLVAIADFCFLQLEDGDIICYQKSLENDGKYRYPDVPSFLEYVHNRQVYLFVPLFLCIYCLFPIVYFLFQIFSCALNSCIHLMTPLFAVTGCSFSIVRKTEGGWFLLRTVRHLKTYYYCLRISVIAWFMDWIIYLFIYLLLFFYIDTLTLVFSLLKAQSFILMMMSWKKLLSALGWMIHQKSGLHLTTAIRSSLNLNL